MLDSLSGVLRVDSSAGSARRCTWRDWHGWSYCPLCLWKEENCRVQVMHQVIEICNRKVPDFSSRIDSQGWSACQAWSGWPPRPDPVGVVHGEAGLQTLMSCTFPKTKVDFMQNFFNSFVYVCSSAQHCRPPSHATFWNKMHCKYFCGNHKHFR